MDGVIGRKFSIIFCLCYFLKGKNSINREILKEKVEINWMILIKSLLFSSIFPFPFSERQFIYIFNYSLRNSFWRNINAFFYYYVLLLL